MRIVFTILLCIVLNANVLSQDKLDLLFRSEKILSSGDTTRALAAFSEVLRLYPQSFSAALRLAEINFAKGDYFNTVQYCNIAQDITENYIDSKSKSFEILGIKPDSSTQFRRYLTDQAYIHHLKGTTRVRQNRPLDAEHEFRRSLALNPNSSRVVLDLAVLLSGQGRYEETKKLLKHSIKSDSVNISTRMNLASLHTNLGEPDSAIYYYNQVITLDSTYRWTYLNLGKLYTEQKKFKSAVYNYTKYIALDSTSEEVFYRRATTYLELKEVEKAKVDWDALIKLSETNPEHYRNRGLTYFQLGLYEEAITDFRAALDFAPDQPYTKINLGYSLYLIGKPKKALQALESGLEIVPNYSLGHYFKALAYFQLRKKKASCKSLDEAIKLGLKDEDIDKKLLKKCF